MAKLKSSLLNMFLSLTIICVGAGSILAALNDVTKGAIETSNKKKLENAIKDVIPGFDNSPSDEVYTKEIQGNTFKIYPAKKNGESIGNAVEAVTMNGFSGEIRIIVGFDKQGKIVNYAILQHAETPGLGSKMDVWFKTDKNNQNILGKDLSKGTLKVSKDGGEVDAITASTITSRAFLEAVNNAYAVLSGNTDATSSATEQADGNSSATEQTNTTSSETEQTDGNSSATTSH